MRKLMTGVLICFALYSCTSVRQIGSLNMVSNRNIDSAKKYKRITTYTGDSKRELRRNAVENLEEAIDLVVRKVPGGEYLMNAKIYQIGDDEFAVTGDVYGVATDAGYNGFKVGDRVTFKRNFDYVKGTITVLLNEDECLVKIDNEEKEEEVDYTDLAKVSEAKP